MLGKIEKVWENEAQNGQPYIVVSIEGQRYSLFDKDFLGKLQEGDVVEYDWKKAGKFRNIRNLERVEFQPQLSAIPDKDRQILRMSCVKSASTIFSDLQAEPQQKVDLTLSAARQFERYITEDDHDPGRDGQGSRPDRRAHGEQH